MTSAEKTTWSSRYIGREVAVDVDVPDLIRRETLDARRFVMEQRFKSGKGVSKVYLVASAHSTQFRAE